jgi:voltage-gated potassium channel Kch
MFSLFITAFRFIRALIAGFKDPEFKGLFFFVLIILLSGTIFYSQIEKWSLLDSLYFSTTTLTTVGYGDLAPKTDLGKIFTIIYLFVGIGVILGFVNIVAHHTNNQNPMKQFFGNSDKKEDKKDQDKE